MKQRRAEAAARQAGCATAIQVEQTLGSAHYNHTNAKPLLLVLQWHDVSDS